jgi:hypothetical protein
MYYLAQHQKNRTNRDERRKAQAGTVRDPRDRKISNNIPISLKIKDEHRFIRETFFGELA